MTTQKIMCFGPSLDMANRVRRYSDYFIVGVFVIDWSVGIYSKVGKKKWKLQKNLTVKKKENDKGKENPRNHEKWFECECQGNGRK